MDPDDAAIRGQEAVLRKEGLAAGIHLADEAHYPVVIVRVDHAGPGARYLHPLLRRAPDQRLNTRADVETSAKEVRLVDVHRRWCLLHERPVEIVRELYVEIDLFTIDHLGQL